MQGCTSCKAMWAAKAVRTSPGAVAAAENGVLLTGARVVVPRLLRQRLERVQLRTPESSNNRA